MLHLMAHGPTLSTFFPHTVKHLKEDMGSMADHLDFSNMTKEEIEFHYFKVHDVDNNDKLDGLEILNAIQHTFHETEVSDGEHKSKTERIKHVTYEDDFPWIIELIDKALEEDDLDNDGYLEYTEYVLGRQRAHIAKAKRNQARTNKEQSLEN
ncbi:multiple coagulation factor deficiency protein 2 homolog isoform X2 [Calliopsis andreniformis]|uniref:multiple coagulation factor deficiency protein 2 homolog isoform X2 n=1 Tax=Calliopsis andreniformis TaxID=337506 RepID=UPI003FCDFCD5